MSEFNYREGAIPDYDLSMQTEDHTDHSGTIDSYIRIHLDSDQLDPTQIKDTLTRLHRLQNDECLEIRLVVDEAIHYYVGTTESRVLEIETILQTLFPEGTNITHEAPPSLPDESDAIDAALTVRGRGERHNDWQTRLRPVTTDQDERTQFPLAGGIDALAESEATVQYQVLLVPKSDWRIDASMRLEQLQRDCDTIGQQVISAILASGPSDAEGTVDRFHQQRIESIEATDPKHTFSVYVRAMADGPDAASTLTTLGDALTVADGEFYTLDPVIHRDGERITAVAEDIATSTPPDSSSIWDRLKRRLPLTSNTDREVVAGALTAPNLFLVDGDSLTSQGQRALQITPDERTTIPRPEDELLAQYDTGMLLGYPLTDDGERIDRAVSLPPSMQSLHAAWFGKTGSGKSTALINTILENHGATDGADILIDPKGDGMPVEYLKSHYAEYGSFEDVYYFDCTETLPALSFFDIRDQLDDGIDRTTAVEDITDHYIEILIGIMGKGRFERAVRSPDIIRYLVKALFDPIHGSDVFAHSELQAAATRMRETRDPPPVVDPELRRMLSGVASNDEQSFNALMQGVANRIEKIPINDRLGRVFNHVPEDDAPRFDLREVIDEDAVVLLDTGGLRPETRRVVSLVFLSQLWTALRRRGRVNEDVEPSLVNLYLEEAATIAQSGLVAQLLAQSRSFGLSMTLAMQFPAQLRETDSEAYAEVLNNVSTIVTGNIAVDADLKKRLATESMTPSEVANRLRALRRGQWFVSLPSEFGREEPRPFLLESAPIPAGHPKGDAPLSSAAQTAFAASFDSVRDRTRFDHGLDLAVTTRAVDDQPGRDGTEGDEKRTERRPDSPLAHTERLPDVVAYDEEKHALLCADCDSRYDPTKEGMKRAIECCHSLDDVDRDNVPICSLSLKLSEDERLQSRLTAAQLRFLQAVYAAHQKRFDSDLEYSLLTDSMDRLQAYVGIEDSGIERLLEDGLLKKDCGYPHVLYTVTPAGRKAAKIRHREGIAYGHNAGDCNESSLHVAMVELGIQYVQDAFVQNPDSPIVEISPYHDIDDGRLDVAGLGEDGDIVVTVEAERSNNDTARAVPSDFDKMAGEEPEAAIWIVNTRSDAHDVLEALNDPLLGDARVEKTYSRSSPPQRFTIDTPGLTEIHTFTYLRDSVLEL